MTAFQGMVFDVSLEGGRKVSQLERTLEINGRATARVGFEVPQDPVPSIVYNPQDDLAEIIGEVTADQDLQQFYQSAVLAAERFLSLLEHPPQQGIDIRIFAYSMPSGSSGGSLSTGSVVSVIDKGGYISQNSILDFDAPPLLRKLVPEEEFAYRDWKDLPDLVPATASQSFYVAHLHSQGSSKVRKVQLRLETANEAYTPSGLVVYTSGTDGFLETLDENDVETDILDHNQLADQHRLPAFAAILASAEYTESVLDVSPNGVLDCMSPTTPHQIRYRIQVSHLAGFQCEVVIKPGDAITGNYFGSARVFLVNLDEMSVERNKE